MKNKHNIIVILLVALAMAFHLVKCVWPDSIGSPLANFSPFIACLLGGAMFFTQRWLVFVPLIFLIVADYTLASSAPQLVDAVIKYSCYLGVIVLGISLRKKVSSISCILGTIGSVFVFYLLLNTSSWFILAEYPKNFAGWLQSQTIGLPSWPPSWVFLKNQLLCNVGFMLVLLILRGYFPSRERGKIKEAIFVSAK